MNRNKQLIFTLLVTLGIPTPKAHADLFLGTYGYRYELGDAYKTGSDTEGSSKSSPGFGLGYQFLRSLSHKFDDDSDNQDDGGAFTGIGFDIYMGRFSVYMDLTSHYLEDRKKHIAGGDFGFRLSFGDVN